MFMLNNMNLFGQSNVASKQGSIVEKSSKKKDPTLDKHFKQLFCKKEFLSPILKNIIPEYEDMSLEEIESLIVANPDVPVQAKLMDTEDIG